MITNYIEYRPDGIFIVTKKNVKDAVTGLPIITILSEEKSRDYHWKESHKIGG